MKKNFLNKILSAILLFSSAACSHTAAGYQSISASEAKEIMDTQKDCILLDVRTQEEYDEGHIPGAVCIPVETIGEEPDPRLSDLNQKILIYCRSGVRAKQAAQKLSTAGYTDVSQFGGINTWPYEIISTAEEQSVTQVLMIDESKSGEKDGVTLKVTGYNAGIIEAEFENHSGKEFTYGAQFQLKYRDRNEWKELEWPEGIDWIAIAYILPDESSEVITCNVQSLEPFKAGEYLLVKEGIEAYFTLVASE